MGHRLHGLRWTSLAHCLPCRLAQLNPDRRSKMKRTMFVLVCVLLFSLRSFAADDVGSAVAGTVRKIDAATRTFVLETDKGVRHTFHYTEEVSVHGVKDI